MSTEQALRRRFVTLRANLALLVGPVLSAVLMVAVPDELPMRWAVLTAVGVLALSIVLIGVGIEWARSIFRADLRRQRAAQAVAAD